MQNYLFGIYFLNISPTARAVRCSPWGPSGPQGPWTGGQGPLGTPGGRRASRLNDCGGGAGQISKNRITRGRGSIQLYGWITLRMYCYENHIQKNIQK